jgi:ketosteroid isomerase-like protein
MEADLVFELPRVGDRVSRKATLGIPGTGIRLGRPSPTARQIVRDSYAAFAGGDRGFFEEHLSDDFVFSAPPDPKLDRDGFFERCWPGAGRGQHFAFIRLIESGDEVVVTYERDVYGGGRGRNTEFSLRRRGQDRPYRGLLRLEPRVVAATTHAERHSGIARVE